MCFPFSEKCLKVDEKVKNNNGDLDGSEGLCLATDNVICFLSSFACPTQQFQPNRMGLRPLPYWAPPSKALSFLLSALPPPAHTSVLELRHVLAPSFPAVWPPSLTSFPLTLRLCPDASERQLPTEGGGGGGGLMARWMLPLLKHMNL